MLQRWLLEHPRSVGETYFEHQRVAFGFSAGLFVAAVACFVHGLVPGLFKQTASGTVERLRDRMIVQRARVEVLRHDEGYTQRADGRVKPTAMDAR